MRGVSPKAQEIVFTVTDGDWMMARPGARDLGSADDESYCRPLPPPPVFPPAPPTLPPPPARAYLPAIALSPPSGALVGASTVPWCRKAPEDPFAISLLASCVSSTVSPPVDADNNQGLGDRRLPG